MIPDECQQRPSTSFRLVRRINHARPESRVKLEFWTWCVGTVNWKPMFGKPPRSLLLTAVEATVQTPTETEVLLTFEHRKTFDMRWIHPKTGKMSRVKIHFPVDLRYLNPRRFGLRNLRKGAR